MVPDTILKVKISIPKNYDIQYPLFDRFALPAPVMNPAGPESALGIPWPFLPVFQINTTKNSRVIPVSKLGK
jgi:hypothetical protein